MARAHVFFVFLKKNKRRFGSPGILAGLKRSRFPAFFCTELRSCVLSSAQMFQQQCVVEKKKSLVSMLERDVREPLAGGLFIRVRE